MLCAYLLTCSITTLAPNVVRLVVSTVSVYKDSGFETSSEDSCPSWVRFDVLSAVNTSMVILSMEMEAVCSKEMPVLTYRSTRDRNRYILPQGFPVLYLSFPSSFLPFFCSFAFILSFLYLWLPSLAYMLTFVFLLVCLRQVSLFISTKENWCMGPLSAAQFFKCHKSDTVTFTLQPRSSSLWHQNKRNKVNLYITIIHAVNL